MQMFSKKSTGHKLCLFCRREGAFPDALCLLTSSRSLPPSFTNSLRFPLSLSLALTLTLLGWEAAVVRRSTRRKAKGEFIKTLSVLQTQLRQQQHKTRSFIVLSRLSLLFPSPPLAVASRTRFLETSEQRERKEAGERDGKEEARVETGFQAGYFGF